VDVVFLGTGTSQGIPVIGCQCTVCQSENAKDKRLRSSVLIRTTHNHLVIDTGPDFRQQMLREKNTRLDAVLFTHEHKDHMAGLDDIRAYNFTQRKDMDVYATNVVQKALMRDFHYAFEEHKYPGVPQINLNTISEQPFNINGDEVIPIQVLHYKMPVLGFRIGNFSYVTDANFIAPEEIEKMKGSEVVVLNALRKTDHISHFNLQQAISLAREIGAKETYLIHLSHQMGLHEEVDAELPEGVYLSYDGLTVHL